MFRNSLIQILDDVWPMLLIFTVIVSSIRIAYVIINKKEFIFYKELLCLGFVIYILCLFYVVTFQDVSWSTSNFIPFKEMFRYDFGSYLFIKNVLGNMLLFLPFGFFISYFLKTNHILPIIILILITSLTIETTQLMIGRVFDVDDITLNLMGGIVGYYLYTILDKIKDVMPNFLKKNYIYNIIVIIVVTLIIMYLFGVLGLEV